MSSNCSTENNKLQQALLLKAGSSQALYTSFADAWDARVPLPVHRGCVGRRAQLRVEHCLKRRRQNAARCKQLGPESLGLAGEGFRPSLLHLSRAVRARCLEQAGRLGWPARFLKVLPRRLADPDTQNHCVEY